MIFYLLNIILLLLLPFTISCDDKNFIGSSKKSSTSDSGTEDKAEDGDALKKGDKSAKNSPTPSPEDFSFTCEGNPLSDMFDAVQGFFEDEETGTSIYQQLYRLARCADHNPDKLVAMKKYFKDAKVSSYAGEDYIIGPQYHFSSSSITGAHFRMRTNGYAPTLALAAEAPVLGVLISQGDIAVSHVGDLQKDVSCVIVSLGSTSISHVNNCWVFSKGKLTVAHFNNTFIEGVKRSLVGTLNAGFSFSSMRYADFIFPDFSKKGCDDKRCEL